MKKLYYEIWADAIEAIRSTESYMTDKDKIVVLLITFSIAQGFNLGFLLLILATFIETPFFLQINLFPGSMLNGAIGGMITLFLPFVIINYILIIRKKYYLKYIHNRTIRSKGKVFLLYFFFSGGLFVFTVIIGKCFF